MQVVLHAGAHKTDEDRLLKCLAKNRDMLRERGVDVPTPGRYRRLIRDTIQASRETGVSDEARDILLDAIVSTESPDRLILSNEGFFGTEKMALGAGKFYSSAVSRLELFQDIFHNDEIELFLAIRDPATFLPAIFSQTPYESFADFLDGTAPTAVRWSELIERIRNALPGLAITVWCNEDTPLIWAQILREMAGLDPTTPIAGEFFLLNEIMSETGMKRFDSYLQSHPGMTEIQKRRVIAAFLDKFANDTAIEEELDVPGWTHELIDRITEIYDEDVYEIQRMSGVNLITP